jgi:two-component system response regulator FlrC
VSVVPILVVEDEKGLREALTDTLMLAGYEALAAADGEQALALLAERQVSLVVTDLQMGHLDGHALLERLKLLRPELPVVMMTGHGSVPGAVRAVKAGAADYLSKPFEPAELLRCVEQHLQPLGQHFVDDEPVAEDPASRALLALAERVARSHVNVMIGGESGTGKEVMARFLHNHSARCAAPFVAINCAAIPEQMLEATLFGYEKGAFTGALQSSKGKFEQAQGGTLLLDEVTEMALGLQAKLLRVLQEREVERLGGQAPIELDVRVIATSNRDLAAEVAANRFREDLYYRLNVFSLTVPPLRERLRDILPLARKFLTRAAAAGQLSVPTLTEDACQRLLGYHWPGNVRELDNVMQRAPILYPGPELGPESLHLESLVQERSDPGAALSEDLRSREQERILDTLREVNGRRGEAAQRLGLSDRTLRHKLARLREAGVSIPGDQRHYRAST